MEIDIGHIVLLSVAGTVVWRWLRTRHLLYRITEKTDALLRRQGKSAINLFKSPKMRKRLALHRLASRLEEKIDRLLESEAATGEDNKRLHRTSL
jgi:hypothetical protein